MEHPIVINSSGKIGSYTAWKSHSSFRANLAAAMALPIRRNLDYHGIARRALMVDPLPQGALPTYDRDIDVSAVATSDDKVTKFEHGKIVVKSGKIGRRIYNRVRRSLDYHGIARRAIKATQFQHDEVIISPNGKINRKSKGLGGRRVVVPTFEVFNNPTIRISEVKRRRFDVIDRAVQKARQEIMAQEDEAIFKAIDMAAKDE